MMDGGPDGRGAGVLQSIVLTWLHFNLKSIMNGWISAFWLFGF